MSSASPFADPPSPAELYHTLSVEPYGLTFAQIGDLTDYQVAEVLSDPEKRRRRRPARAKASRARPQHVSSDPREEFVRLLTAQGWTAEQALLHYEATFGRRED